MFVQNFTKEIERDLTIVVFLEHEVNSNDITDVEDELKRIDYRMIFEDDLREYLKSLNKPVIYCGDLNVAHNPIDLKNPKANENNAGYSIQI